MQEFSAPILIVEDDEAIRDAIHGLLSVEGVRGLAASTLEEARRHLANTRVAGVILDYGLPDGTGDELLEEIARAPNPVPVLLVSAHPDARSVADHFGVAFVKKPFDVEVFLAAVDTLADGRGSPHPGTGDRPTVPSHERRKGAPPSSRP